MGSLPPQKWPVMIEAYRPRRWYVALSLSLAGIGTSYVYVGKPKRAAALAAYSSLMLMIQWHGLWGWLAEPWIGYGLALVSLIIQLAVVNDLVRTADRAAQYRLQWYNRWWMYGGICLASLLFVSLPDVPGTGLKNSVKTYGFPSSSMEPAIMAGDYGVADMRAYDAAGPLRGDVVTFRHPHDKTHYVKRIIGLPGDTIEMRDGIPHINGSQLPTKDDGTFSAVQPGDTKPTTFRLLLETQPNGRIVRIQKWGKNGPLDNMVQVTVPPGHYFALGDNRDNSTDSRVTGRWGIGMVPRANILGRVSWTAWSRDWSRIGQHVR
jgi:signal peptidase I